MSGFWHCSDWRFPTRSSQSQGVAYRAGPDPKRTFRQQISQEESRRSALKSTGMNRIE